eukprot:366062-Chlamydomonas_euryale.AAC.5
MRPQREQSGTWAPGRPGSRAGRSFRDSSCGGGSGGGMRVELGWQHRRGRARGEVGGMGRWKRAGLAKGIAMSGEDSEVATTSGSSGFTSCT